MNIQTLSNEPSLEASKQLFTYRLLTSPGLSRNHVFVESKSEGNLFEYKRNKLKFTTS